MKMDLLVRKAKLDRQVHQDKMDWKEPKAREVKSVQNVHYLRGDPREMLGMMANQGKQELLDRPVMPGLKEMLERLEVMGQVEDLEIR